MPGLYRATVPELFSRQIASAIGEDGKIIFSVAAGKAESDLSAVTQEQIDWLNKYIQLTIADKYDNVIAVLQGKMFGKEIWRILAIAVFLFLITEVLLTRWIAINRRSGEEQNVDFTNEGKAGTASFKKSLAAMGK